MESLTFYFLCALVISEAQWMTWASPPIQHQQGRMRWWNWDSLVLFRLPSPFCGAHCVAELLSLPHNSKGCDSGPSILPLPMEAKGHTRVLLSIEAVRCCKCLTYFCGKVSVGRRRRWTSIQLSAVSQCPFLPGWCQELNVYTHTQLMLYINRVDCLLKRRLNGTQSLIILHPKCLGYILKNHLSYKELGKNGQKVNIYYYTKKYII